MHREVIAHDDIAGIAALRHPRRRSFVGEAIGKHDVVAVLLFIVMVVLGAVSLGYAIWGMNHGQDVMTQNLNTKYGVESVEGKGWRGNAGAPGSTRPRDLE